MSISYIRIHMNLPVVGNGTSSAGLGAALMALGFNATAASEAGSDGSLSFLADFDDGSTGTHSFSLAR